MLSVGSSRKPTLELFPFISLFLCVIGVLIQAGREFDKESDGQTLMFEPAFNELALQVALNEISTLNLLAKEHGIEYEEFVLLSVHSGGSDADHYITRLLDVPTFRHIRSGLDVAGSNAARSNAEATDEL